jgi:KDO2-lipid IV(A) lauroyltransferase
MLAWTIAGMGRLIGTLPVPVGLALGRTLGRVAHRILATPRRLARRHVAIAFPELDEVARRRLVRATFEHAGQSFTELSMLRRLLRRPDYVVLEGADVLDAGLAGGRGMFVIAGHIGNWELLAAWVASVGYPLTVVVRRVNDLRFHGLIARFREAAGVELLVRDAPDFMAGVRSALTRNRIVALLIDQDSRGPGVFVPFFGRLAHTPPGAALLALRTGVPVATSFIARRPEGGHRVTFASVPVARGRGRDAVVTLTARFTAAIEAHIRSAPAEWVWWHERWRRRPPATQVEGSRRPAKLYSPGPPW